MALLFISDLHLRGEQPETLGLFLRFLAAEAAHSDGLYILGDLFEVWLGDDLIPPEYQSAIEAMRRLSASVPLFVMRGNRDFLFGPHFEALTGCRLIDEPWPVEIDGQRVVLLHGDTLCTDDLPYQQMRRQLRDPAWISTFLSRPAAERIAFARGLREKSREETQAKSYASMDVNAGEVARQMRECNADLLIHGHTHRQGHHLLEIDGRKAQRWALGEWGTTGNALRYDENGWSFAEVM